MARETIRWWALSSVERHLQRIRWTSYGGRLQVAMTSLPHKGAHACTHMRLSTDIFSPTQHTHTKKKGRGIKIYRRKISKTAVRFEPASCCSTATLSCKALPSVFHLSKGGGCFVYLCCPLGGEGWCAQNCRRLSQWSSDWHASRSTWAPGKRVFWRHSWNN